MKHTSFTFDTPKAQAQLQLMRDRMHEDEAATVFDLAEVIGKSRYTAKYYLMHLRDRGEVVCVAEAHVRPGMGTVPALWVMKDAPAPKPASTTSCIPVDEFARKVVVRQQWEPHHVRMGLECYLFGVPAALQGAAA